MRTIKLNSKKYRGTQSLPTLSASEVRQIVSALITEHLGLQADGIERNWLDSFKNGHVTPESVRRRRLGAGDEELSTRMNQTGVILLRF